MSKDDRFTSTIAARTRCAQTLLSDRDLLEVFLDVGGTKDDLSGIASAGLRAEAANRGQSTAVASGKAATIGVLTSFDEARSEYAAIMNVLPAVRADLVRANAPAELVVAVEKIIENEVPVRFATVVAGDAKKRKARRVESQEAERAEMSKDLAALVALKDVHPALAKRRVDRKRLEKARAAAEALSGQLGERALKKGARRDATALEREAVQEQKDLWAATSRLLAAVAARKPALQPLLREAARRR